jgi:GT2 family glycosyltransferase
MGPQSTDSNAAAAGSLERPLVSIVILSFNRPALLTLSVASVLAQSYPNIEVCVIDNRSPSSDEIAALMRAEPRVTFLANAENLGFTGGMNQGFRRARGKYVHFTEDDIEMDSECIQHLVDHMEANPDTALASGIMLHPDGTIASAGGTVTLDATYRVEMPRANQKFDPSLPLAPYEVSFVPGSFILARREVVTRIGAFNDDFYLYHEDTELCVRTLKAGYKVMVVPAARVFHATRPAAASPDYVAFHRRKNFIATYVIHAPWSVIPEFFLRHVIVSGVRAASSNRSQLRTHFAAYKWVVKHLPKLWRERHRVEQLSSQRAG